MAAKPIFPTATVARPDFETVVQNYYAMAEAQGLEANVVLHRCARNDLLRHSPSRLSLGAATTL